MSEEISDFAGAGTNVVANGVSIAQYRVVCQMLVFGSGYEGGHRLESVKAKNN
ncbi:hypothetical protein [Bifidobacterium pseudolongum]|uniref:Uncharacterized protein n=1 Tax=Bifidobacterium pseudolongum subsp. globosum TaxID=1690 RepID=A0A4Q5A5Q8_9BIFI|nr:hypothetical protein [Bifidobacterium pseudolongum]RYQ19407.1 hypothetical protein PG2071B_0817 [Bifidobacterium pseudolongum subsp. globosum]